MQANLEAIFAHALELAAADRDAYLDQACAGNAALRQQVDALLRAHADAGSFLERPAHEQPIAAPPRPTSDTERVADSSAGGVPPVPGPGQAATGRFPLLDPDGTITSLLEPSQEDGSLGRLGHYEVLEIIGKGGFGTVLRAFDSKLQRTVAIKLMSPELAVTSPARKRFLREAQAAAKIRHEHVVQIHSVEELPLPYLVMEYIPGQTLEQKLNATGPLHVPEVVTLGQQMASGLAAAHAIGLIHRDIKPANILLEGGIDERVKITDFGLARAADDASLTQSGMVAGTPMYMAPEQANGQSLDQRADLFSLGSVLYQMVSGRPPFRAESTLAVLKRVVDDTPRPIREIIPETPEWLCAIIQKLHAKQPEDRIQTARELADLLKQSAKAIEQGREPQLPWPVPSSPPTQEMPAAYLRPVSAPAKKRTRRLIRPLIAGMITLAVSLGLTEATGVTRLATTIMRLTTGAGTLIIVADDPTLSIALNGKDLGIQDGGVKEFTLRPGSYTIIASKNGTAVKQDLVQITRGGRQVLRLTLDAGASAAVASPGPVATPKPLTPMVVEADTPGAADPGGPVSAPRPLTPLVVDLDVSDPLPTWELPAGAPSAVVAPCEPGRATELQAEWAEFLQRPVVEEFSAKPELGMKFALIPPGEFRKVFTRPADPAIEPEMPVRRFRITKPYALSTTEITWDQFRQFVEATGYETDAETNGKGGYGRDLQSNPQNTWRNPGWKPDPHEPACQVTPRDAAAFCAWLTSQSATFDQASNGMPPRFLFRLPTEAEWSHACRAGSIHKYVVGPSSDDLADSAWTREFLHPNPQSSPLNPVAQKKANPFGLYDMLGNVWEQSADVITAPLLPTLPTENPIGWPVASSLGYSTLEPATSVQAETSTYGYAHLPWYNIGFRVLQQFEAEPLAGPLDHPLLLRPSQPLSVHALVPRPEEVPGLRSWSVELAGPHYDSSIVAVNPRGDLIATGSLYGKINLWDRDGRYQRALLGHEGNVTSLDFSPNGRWLASCEIITGESSLERGTARVWNVETGALQAVIPISGWAYRARFSPDGERLAVSFSRQYQPSFVIVDLKFGTSHLPESETGGRGLCWSPDGTELVCSHTDNQLRVWDAKSLKLLRAVEATYSNPLEISPDGRRLALQHSDGTVAIRDVPTLKMVHTDNVAAYVGNADALSWQSDSRRLLIARSNVPSSVFDTVSGEAVTTFVGMEGGGGIALVQEGREVVHCANGRLNFYDTSSGRKLREGPTHGAVSYSLATLAPHGRELFSQVQGTIYVSNAETGQRLRRFIATNTTDVPIPSPDGTFLGLHSLNPIRVLPLVSAEWGTKRHELDHSQGNVTCMVWSPAGTWLATGATDKQVRIWNGSSGKLEHELAGHTGSIWSLAWSPDGTRLATAAEDKTVRVWDPRAGRLVATYDKLPEAPANLSWDSQILSWAADSRRLWIALSRQIVSLDVETGTFAPIENFSNGNLVSFLSMSPNGQRLLVREHYDWTFVRGPEAQDRRLLGQWLGRTAQWHPDSRRFLGTEARYGTIGYDVETNRRLGTLLHLQTDNHWLCIGPTGHYRGSQGVEEHIMYVGQLEDGSQVTYTPAEFAQKFDWKNNPDKATLLGLEE